MKLLIPVFTLLALCRAQHYTFVGTTGKLYSPNYPSNYDNSDNVVYNIKVPAGSYIHLTFLDFFTEASYDVLTVENDTTVSGDKTGLSLDIEASDGTLTFTSDLTTTYRGFVIQFDSVTVGNAFMPSNLCPAQLHNSPFDIITSPNFPYNYPDNISCAFLITVEEDYLISLQFVAFNTEDGYDILSVYDGANTSATLLGQFSGKKIPAAITSSTNTMYLFFESDLVNNFSGFSGLYTSVEPNNFKRGVLPQDGTTESSLQQKVNLIKWLKKKAQDKATLPKILPKIDASIAI